MNIVLLMAAGSGSRFGADKNKLDVEIDGLPVIKHTYDIFFEHNLIDEIVIVGPSKYKDLFENVTIIEGGKERSESVKNGLDFIASKYSSEDNITVLIHDGARPYVSSEIISDVIFAINDENYEGAVPCVSVTNTTYEIDGDDLQKVLDRSSLVNAQTPQTFKFANIYEAYCKVSSGNDLQKFTDDISVLKFFNDEARIKITYGSEGNKKITYKNDLN